MNIPGDDKKLASYLGAGSCVLKGSDRPNTAIGQQCAGQGMTVSTPQIKGQLSGPFASAAMGMDPPQSGMDQQAPAPAFTPLQNAI